MVAGIIGGGCISQKPAVDRGESLEFAAAEDGWAEKTLRRLSVEEKVAQMVVPKVFGFYISAQSDEWKRIVHLVKERKVGGIAIFAGEVYETAIIINRSQELADVPLLVSADFERGLAMRTRRTTAFPDAMAVAAARDTHLAYMMGKIVAEETRAIGVHQNFAPVADVNTNPDNPVINTRSFGEDPRWVAEIAAAYAKGLQDGNVIATAKHFPGHGDTNVDSHLGLPVLNVGRNRLDTVELVPFRKLIKDGVMSVMIAHIALPAIDTAGEIPATLSTHISTQVLKDELGFEGLIVSDAIDMQGLLNSFPMDEAVVRAVEAGIDVLLVPPVERDDEVIDALKHAVMSGRLSEERIDRSVMKILNLKKWLKLNERRTVDLLRIADVVGTPGHWDAAHAIARSAITVLKNDPVSINGNGVLPLQRLELKKIANVIISDNEDYRTDVHRPSGRIPNERVGNYFTLQLKLRYSNVETIRLDPRTTEAEFESILTSVQTSDVIVCPVFVKARSASGKFGLPQHLIDFANLLTTKGKPTVFIAMGSPYILGALKNGSAYLCAYSDGELATEAVVEVLFGEISSRGRLPVSIPGIFTIGSGLELPQYALRRDTPARVGFDQQGLFKLDTIITKAILDSAFPGSQLLVAKDGLIGYNRSFGRLQYSTVSAQVNNTTMYDLASLTKVIATTAGVMKLYDEGKLVLDDLVVKYIPEFGNRRKEKITIRNLLLHNSGLPAFKRLYLSCSSEKEALDSVVNSELIYTPGDSMVYSDFGFITLGKIIERITGEALDAYTARKFFEPLGMRQTMFNPPGTLWNNIAPTEFDTVWRDRLVHGTVHDETAALFGGVAGHAGLFSTASDLAIFMQMLMNGGTYGGKQYLKPETIKLFTANSSTGSTRVLGWDTKSTTGYSSAGSLFSEKSFGHTGFTGTSIWADPERNLFVIFLTNRVYPTRENRKIYRVRPAVHDVVIKALRNSLHHNHH